MLRKLFSLVVSPTPQERDATIYRNMLRDVAQMGGTVFGPIPKGVRREFFALDEHTWVWHEEWTDENGKYRVCTTRYDIRPHGILKAQDGQPYQRVSADEANRLCDAAQEFQRLIHAKFDPLLSPA